MIANYKAIFMVVVMVLGAAFISSAGAESLDVTDDAAYASYMNKAVEEIHGLYVKASNKSIPQGDAEVARVSAFRKAREAFNYMHKRFQKMEVGGGAALSPDEMLINNHLMAMTMNLLTSEHLPHEDRWSYTY